MKNVNFSSIKKLLLISYQIITGNIFLSGGSVCEAQRPNGENDSKDGIHFEIW